MVRQTGCHMTADHMSPPELRIVTSSPSSSTVGCYRLQRLLMRLLVSTTTEYLLKLWKVAGGRLVRNLISDAKALILRQNSVLIGCSGPIGQTPATWRIKKTSFLLTSLAFSCVEQTADVALGFIHYADANVIWCPMEAGEERFHGQRTHLPSIDGNLSRLLFQEDKACLCTADSSDMSPCPPKCLLTSLRPSGRVQTSFVRDVW